MLQGVGSYLLLFQKNYQINFIKLYAGRCGRRNVRHLEDNKLTKGSHIKNFDDEIDT